MAIPFVKYGAGWKSCLILKKPLTRISGPRITGPVPSEDALSPPGFLPIFAIFCQIMLIFSNPDNPLGVLKIVTQAQKKALTG